MASANTTNNNVGSSSNFFNSFDMTSPKSRLQLSHAVSLVCFHLWHAGEPTPQLAPHAAKVRTVMCDLLKSLTSRISVHAVLLSLLYVKRLVTCMDSHIKPQSGSELRPLCVALMLADIQVNDKAIPISLWSQATGIVPQEIAAMKREFLLAIGFDLHVTSVQYADWVRVVSRFLKEEAKKQALVIRLNALQGVTPLSPMISPILPSSPIQMPSQLPYTAPTESNFII